MSFPVMWFEVWGPDGKVLQNFYSTLFDWKIDADNPMQYGMVNNAGDGIDGGVGGSPEDSARVTFYVRADDPDATLKQVEKLGGKLVMPVTPVPGGPTIAMFSDPAGNVIGLMKNEPMP